MGKGTTLIRFICLSLLILLSALVHAKMDFPPELKDGDELRARASRIRTELHETHTSTNRSITHGDAAGIEEFLRREQELVAHLKTMPDYMKMAEARPPLQMLSFRRVSIKEVTGNGASPEWTKFVSKYGDPSLSQTSDIKPQLHQLFDEWTREPSQGFFSGWASLLSKDGRSILSNPVLEERWAQIKEELQGVDIQELRRKFRAERFGIESKEWNLNDLDKVVAKLIYRENRIAALIQQLNVERNHAGQAWFNDENLSEWIGSSELDGRVEKLVLSLKGRMESLFGNPNAKIRAEHVDRELIIREIPPYLAIYRGCVGNDCSTASSWAFPYAPMERNFWVEETNGNRLAYVSGAITDIEGKPCLYIRDISGPSLAPSDIPLIMDGFYLARALYGAEYMTIAHTSFLNQNHFPGLRDQIRLYGDGTSVLVNQTFADTNIRMNVLGVLPGSGLGYDNPLTQHRTVRKVNRLDQDLVHVRVKRLAGEMNLKDPNKDPEALWTMLQDAVTFGETSALEISMVQSVNWREVVSAIRNVTRLNAKEYYGSVEKLFADNKLPFSRNMMRKNEHLFMIGHLAAPDAFQSENVRQSVRYVTDMVWRNKGSLDQAAALISANLTVLEENEIFIRSVRSIFERKREEDVKRADFLFKSGFRFTHTELSMDDLQWLTASLPEPEINRWMIHRILKSTTNLKVEDIEQPVADAIARLLNNEDESVDEGISIEAANMFYKIRGLVKATTLTKKEVLESIDTDENPQVRVPLAVAFLRDMGTNGEESMSVGVILRKDISAGNVPPEMLPRAQDLVGSMRLPREEEDGNCERDLRRR